MKSGDESGPEAVFSSGILIEHKVNRGTGYHDSTGAHINIRYIPVTITNDSTVPIRYRIEFLQEYEHTGEHGPQKFRMIPMPEIWTLDGIEVTDSMFAGLQPYIDKPVWERTLQPGDSEVFAIGSVYEAVNYGIVPNALFTQNERHLYPNCEDSQASAKTADTHLTVELKLGYYHWSTAESCSVISCGRIWYPEK